ncbi:MAG: hypothetical protein GY711_01840 [bacterium]|nr:hypothetical protein [bacterium]
MTDPDRPYVWEAEAALCRASFSLREIAVLRGHEGPVNQAAFSPDGGRIITASYDNTARLFALYGAQALIDHAREVAPRQLTPEQRERFFLNADR